VLSAQVLVAQPQVEMADTLRSEGKIYVVVAVILVIFGGACSIPFSNRRRYPSGEELAR